MIRIITLLGLAFLLASCGEKPEKEAEPETTQTPDDLATAKADANAKIADAETKVIGTTVATVVTPGTFARFVAKRNDDKLSIEKTAASLKTLLGNAAATKKDIKDKTAKLATKLAAAQDLENAIAAAEAAIADATALAEDLASLNADEINAAIEAAQNETATVHAVIDDEAKTRLEIDAAKNKLANLITAANSIVRVADTLANALIDAKAVKAEAEALKTVAGAGKPDVDALIVLVKVADLDAAIGTAETAGGKTDNEKRNDLKRVTKLRKIEIRHVTDKIEQIRRANEFATSKITDANPLALIDVNATGATEINKAIKAATDKVTDLEGVMNDDTKTVAEMNNVTFELANLTEIANNTNTEIETAIRNANAAIDTATNMPLAADATTGKNAIDAAVQAAKAGIPAVRTAITNKADATKVSIETATTKLSNLITAANNTKTGIENAISLATTLIGIATNMETVGDDTPNKVNINDAVQAAKDAIPALRNAITNKVDADKASIEAATKILDDLIEAVHKLIKKAKKKAKNDALDGAIKTAQELHSNAAYNDAKYDAAKKLFQDVIDEVTAAVNGVDYAAEVAQKLIPLAEATTKFNEAVAAI